MASGRLLADRFDLDDAAAAGGMGVVRRALDRETGRAVAVKLALAPHGGGAERFLREARLVAELVHPAIVEHVAHGLLPSGEPYLVLEWLEGEDLSDRLARGPLSVAETLALGERIAGALAHAHGRGVVHRDVKPANLFLVGGDPARAKLLDFGVARDASLGRLTRTGAAVGTPAYMAPEQARGERTIAARADVFALGCVLFECLAGRPPFVADSLMALLARIVLEAPPRLSELRAGLPPALVDLVERMLAKDPAERPADGDAVLRALSTIEPTVEGPRPAQVAARDQDQLTLVLVRHPSSAASAADAETLLSDAALAQLDVLRALSRRHGATLAPFADGSAALVWAGSEARDDAARAARCALALRAALPDQAISLATGRGERTRTGAAGEVIERAASLVSRAAGSGPVLVDDVAAALLSDRFDVKTGEVSALVAEAPGGDDDRRLLGRATPFVGREAEMAMLGSLLDQAADEPAARAALVTAPAGTGKSRLRRAFLSLVRARRPEATALLAHADPVRGGAPLGLALDLLRAAAGLTGGEEPEEQRGALTRHLGELLPADRAAHAAEFLAEVLGAPAPAASTALRAARQDPVQMAEQVRSALHQWLAGAAARGPLVLALDDLQWGDGASLALLDAALSNLRDAPLLVVAFARPEVGERFPSLWASRDVQHLRVGPLGRKPSERLVRAVLGPEAPDALVASLVERAAGNAFFLEELVRAAAEGRADRLPETIVAISRARLTALEPELRRALRAASVFGERFWAGGVARLLGPGDDAPALCAELVRRELAVRAPASRHAGELEFAFRHAFVREAAYDLLLAADRAAAHRLCAAWLEERGAREPLVVADHYERSDEPARALPHLVAAASLALRASDLRAASSLARRGLDACERSGATGPERRDLLVVDLEACVERHENERAVALCEQIMRASPSAHPAWARAAGMLIPLASGTGDLPRALTAIEELEATPIDPDAPTEHVKAISGAAYGLLLTGQRERLASLWAKVAPLRTADGGAREPVLEGSIEWTWLCHAFASGADPWTLLSGYQRCAALLERAEYRGWGAFLRAFVGLGELFSGDLESAGATLDAAATAAGSSGSAIAVFLVDATRAALLARLGRFGESDAVVTRAVRNAEQAGDSTGVGFGFMIRALSAQLRGDDAAAVRHADDAVARLFIIPYWRALALSIGARAHAQRGSLHEARKLADKARLLDDRIGLPAWGRPLFLLARAEALGAGGPAPKPEARRAALDAAAYVRAVAARAPSDTARARYLAIEEHARTVALAARLEG